MTVITITNMQQDTRPEVVYHSIMDVEQMTWAIPLHVEEHHASWLGSGGEPNPKSEDVKHSEFANLVVSSHASYQLYAA